MPEQTYKLKFLKDLKKKTIYISMLLLAWMLAACGGRQEAQAGQEKGEISQMISAEGQSINDAESIIDTPLSSGTDKEQDAGSDRENREKGVEEATQEDEWKQMFGENCISSQTFEVELSEYDGKVYFVPFAPSEEKPDFYMQVIRDGEVLTEIHAYVPETLETKKFASLDAVSFYDVNYDGNTDIVLVETYGDTSFAAVYDGFYTDEEDDMGNFYPDSYLSEAISKQADPLTVSGIRSLMGWKKNGEFTGYGEAYEAVSRLYELSYEDTLDYDLIYVDEDEIPELVAGKNGYWLSLYTYHDGTVYTLMDWWGYGVMGNAGYEYVPKANRMRNYNTDFAGAILHTSYMWVDGQHTLDWMTITTYNFDDVNGNGMPDENEEESMGKYSVSYVDGVEITDGQYQEYDEGEYEYIRGTMGGTELREALR